MTGKREPDSVGKCHLLSEEVEARAVEAVSEAREGVRRGMHVNTTHGYREQENYAIVDRLAPVIAEAGYRAGIEDARKKIQVAAERYDGQRDRANWQDPFRMGKTAGFYAAIEALTDTEGRDE